MRSRGRGLSGVVTAVGALALVAALWNGAAADLMHELFPPASGQGEGTAVSAQEVQAAQSALGGLAVEPLSSEAGYAREQFGQRWADVDRNGCDQRNDALRAAAVPGTVEIKPGTHGCVVLRAQIEGPYTGERIEFVKGASTVDIDHVVPLSRAWRQGAAGWPEAERERFANESGNLLAVDASANRAKGDAGPEEWMPEVGRCGYVVQWIQVKQEWELSVTVSEKAAVSEQLEQCREGEQ